ncbi:unnamed protein product [Camellia sinensis]
MASSVVSDVVLVVRGECVFLKCSRHQLCGLRFSDILKMEVSTGDGGIGYPWFIFRWVSLFLSREPFPVGEHGCEAMTAFGGFDLPPVCVGLVPGTQ